MALRAGLEPATNRLTADRSTIELPQNRSANYTIPLLMIQDLSILFIPLGLQSKLSTLLTFSS